MKHFNYDQRLLIQRALTLGWSFSRIAGWTGKDRTSVSREIRSHISGEGKPARSKCRFRHECVFDDPSKCPAPSCNKKVCTISCSQCALFCDRFEPEICPKLLKPPYVCNGCKERGNGCHLSKRLYDAEYAHKMYKHTLSDSRSGISLTEDELQHIAETVIPLLKKGISLPVAYAAYADSMPVSERTLYDYIDKGVFDAGNLDLRRKVRRKPSRQKSGPVLHVDKKCHVGRTYADFLAFTDEHPELGISEMDTVEGRQGGKVILTIFFRNCKLQLMFLRDSKNAAAVSASYAWMREALGTDFSSVFQVILSDRGSQYTSEDFRSLLASNNMRQSLSGVDHCFDNARMESFFATLKKELLYRIPTYRMRMAEVKSWIFRYVFTYYNTVRIYTSNPDGLPPAAYRKQLAVEVLAA